MRRKIFWLQILNLFLIILFLIFAGCEKKISSEQIKNFSNKKNKNLVAAAIIYILKWPISKKNIPRQIRENYKNLIFDAEKNFEKQK